jgi:hypothetical protein
MTPPPDWTTVKMLTYSTPVGVQTPKTMPISPVSKPPLYTGFMGLSKTWGDMVAWPIPTGYVSPNIVPKDPQTGQLTYFGIGTPACGDPVLTEYQLSVAISWVIFDLGKEVGGSVLEHTFDDKVYMANVTITSGQSALCNRSIRVWLDDGKGGKSVEQQFIVRDRCVGCHPTDLDIQWGIFRDYWHDGTAGRLIVTWEWMEAAATGAP